MSNLILPDIAKASHEPGPTGRLWRLLIAMGMGTDPDAIRAWMIDEEKRNAKAWECVAAVGDATARCLWAAGVYATDPIQAVQNVGLPVFQRTLQEHVTQHNIRRTANGILLPSQES